MLLYSTRSASVKTVWQQAIGIFGLILSSPFTFQQECLIFYKLNAQSYRTTDWKSTSTERMQLATDFIYSTFRKEI
ncbi:hypothetical protein D478_23818 [Brevibacillus agri BAB-2500]|nr:hypothetical protein D478_23818 [Brevibacillus agri BAB-2500]